MLLGTSAATQQALPLAESLEASSSGGVLSWFLGERPTTAVPALFEPLEGLNLLPEDVRLGETRVTTLGNGVKIASQNIAGPMFTIGVFIDSGSKNKTPFCMGALHLLEGMVFMSTTNRSHFRVVCEVEAIGGNVVANSSSKQMCYTGNAIRAFIPEMVELLLDTVRSLLSDEWEVHEQLAKVKAAIILLR